VNSSDTRLDSIVQISLLIYLSSLDTFQLAAVSSHPESPEVAVVMQPIVGGDVVEVHGTLQDAPTDGITWPCILPWIG
jgi:hypothetical protein